MNDKFIQIRGPFTAGQDLISYIKTQYGSNFNYIKKIGIQTKVKNEVTINNVDFEIGKTGILEFENVQINSLSFKQDELSSTLIDCILE